MPPACRRHRGAHLALGLVLAALVSLAPLNAMAQSDGEPGADPLDLLIVDETKTFQASLLVNAIASGLQRTAMFNTAAVFPDVGSSFADPLGENTGDARYDVILVVPRAEVLFGLRQVWIASCDLPHEASPKVIRGVRTMEAIIERNDQLEINALRVDEDALPGYFATLFMNNGWLRCGSES